MHTKFEIAQRITNYNFVKHRIYFGQCCLMNIFNTSMARLEWLLQKLDQFVSCCGIFFSTTYEITFFRKSSSLWRSANTKTSQALSWVKFLIRNSEQAFFNSSTAYLSPALYRSFAVSILSCGSIPVYKYRKKCSKMELLISSTLTTPVLPSTILLLSIAEKTAERLSRIFLWAWNLDLSQVITTSELELPSNSFEKSLDSALKWVIFSK